VEQSKKNGDDSPKAEPTLTVEEQLDLLLTNLGKNTKLNAKLQPAPRRQQVMQSSGPGLMPQQASQLITQAYHLINEVIMYP